MKSNVVDHHLGQAVDVLVESSEVDFEGRGRASRDDGRPLAGCA